MKKTISAIIMLVMIFSLSACSIDVTGARNMQKQIAELQGKIKNQDDQFADLIKENELLTDMINELEKQNELLTDMIDGLEDENEILKNRIDELEKELEKLKPKPALAEWTDENTVTVIIGFTPENIDKILDDVESAFKTLNFDAVYIVNKSLNVPLSWNGTISLLKLIFILNESGGDKQQEFIDSLYWDDYVIYAWAGSEAPFETVDTRHIDVITDTINVGETLTVTYNGYLKQYRQPFSFDGLWVELSDYDADKTYAIADFPQVNLASITQHEYEEPDIFYDRYYPEQLSTTSYGCRFYLELAEPGYFNIIKAADALSRISTTKIVWLDVPDDDSMPTDPAPPPMWEISDKAIADFADGFGSDDFPQTTIIGLKPGKVTISYNSVIITITVK